MLIVKLKPGVRMDREELISLYAGKWCFRDQSKSTDIKLMSTQIKLTAILFEQRVGKQYFAGS